VTSTTWTFARQQQRLVVNERDAAGGFRLIISCDEAPKSYSFPTASARSRFKSDMEAFLLKTGWTFLDFSPDRRRGRDRRGFPRMEERRRWWTDGVKEMKKVVWGG